MTYESTETHDIYLRVVLVFARRNDWQVAVNQRRNYASFISLASTGMVCETIYCLAHC